MDNCTLTIEYDSTTKELTCKKGITILDALEPEQRNRIETPCGGKGICGKCKVKILGNGVSGPTEIERKKLTDKEIDEGIRLACLTKVENDTHIVFPSESSPMQILELGIEYLGDPEPCVEKTAVTMEKPTLEDQTDDFNRLTESLKREDLVYSMKGLAALPKLLRENDYKVTVVHNEKEIITVEPGDTAAENYGIAVDIGTTTVVAYLVNLHTGKKIDAASDQNSQKQYGQDVISRINHTIQEKNGLRTLQRLIIDQINGLIDTLLSDNDISRTRLYSITIAGNTTMIHLAAGMPPEYIATVPFIPVATKKIILTAEQAGLRIAEGGTAYFLPSISGYVGADIVSAVLASEMHRSEELNLLIDIGTNGEIVLGNRDMLIACSTAAGPAFEGATIRHGVGGVAGAINTVEMGKTKLSFTTIGEKPPIGICGSGIVDTVSTLLYFGLIDTSGRIVEREEVPTETGRLLADRLTTVDDQPAFIISENGPGGNPIVLTQRDVREIQNAKAAIAAGIVTLIKYADKTIDDIKNVYLAGGFGSYMDRMHAANIGLIPSRLEDNIKVIGNAAGSGAIISLVSKRKLYECDEIVRHTKYVELSSSPEFQEDYVNNMFFGDSL